MKTGKKGFSSVFLTMIFGSMIILTFAFIHASSDKAMESSCDAVFSLAGQSILTEFDLRLKEEYGLIAFCLSSQEIENRLLYYANSTFKSKRKLNMIPIELNGVEIDLKEYSMSNVDKFENSIVDFMKFKMANNLLKERKTDETSTSGADRVLRDKTIQESLPSKGVGETSLLIEMISHGDIGSIEDALKKGSRGFLINAYIYESFKNSKNNKAVKMDTFFNNEMEYILYGKFGDYENRKEFKADFIKLRTMLNLVHIYTDKIKVKEVCTLAEILTPGPAALGTQGIIAAAWACTEALNDWKLLDAGKKVALVKNKKNWALDIDSYERTQSDFIEPSDKRGYNYQDYLKMFLYLEDRELKLLRVMDLIQINLIGNYDESFLMKNYFSGFKYSVTANEKNFDYEQKY